MGLGAWRGLPRSGRLLPPPLWVRPPQDADQARATHAPQPLRVQVSITEVARPKAVAQ